MTLSILIISVEGTVFTFPASSVSNTWNCTAVPFTNGWLYAHPKFACSSGPSKTTVVHPPKAQIVPSLFVSALLLWSVTVSNRDPPLSLFAYSTTLLFVIVLLSRPFR